MKHIFGMIVLGLVITGCARVSVVTAVHADGAFDRVSTFSVSGGNVNTNEAKAKHDVVASVFRIPTENGSAHVSRIYGDNELKVNVARKVPAGASPISDISVVNDGKTNIQNEVSVRAIGNGKFEYLETIRDFRPKDKNLVLADARFRMVVKQTLLSTDTKQIDRTTKALMMEMIHSLVGPPEPLAPDFLLTTPEIAVRKMRARLAPDFDAILTTEGVSQSARKAFTARVFEMMSQDPNNVFPKSMSNTSSQNSVSMGFAVSVPGKVLETNGLTDPVTGEIYWSMLSPGVFWEPVKLRVVFQP